MVSAGARGEANVSLVLCSILTVNAMAMHSQKATLNLQSHTQIDKCPTPMIRGYRLILTAILRHLREHL